jgi:hypothetical protein
MMAMTNRVSKSTRLQITVPLEAREHMVRVMAGQPRRNLFEH